MELIQLKAATKAKAADFLNTRYKDIGIPSGSTVKIFLPDGSTETLKNKRNYFHDDGTLFTPTETKEHIKSLAIAKGYAAMWGKPDSQSSNPCFSQVAYYKDRPKIEKCYICKEEKSMDNFYKCKEDHEGYECGYSSACKECLVIEMDGFSRLFVKEE